MPYVISITTCNERKMRFRFAHSRGVFIYFVFVFLLSEKVFEEVSRASSSFDNDTIDIVYYDNCVVIGRMRKKKNPHSVLRPPALFDIGRNRVPKTKKVVNKWILIFFSRHQFRRFRRTIRFVTRDKKKGIRVTKKIRESSGIVVVGCRLTIIIVLLEQERMRTTERHNCNLCPGTH